MKIQSKINMQPFKNLIRDGLIAQYSENKKEPFIEILHNVQ